MQNLKRIYIISIILSIVNCTTGDNPGGMDPIWEMQNSTTTESFRGLHVVDSRIAWASGTNRTVIRTTDGGTTWNAVMVPGSEALDFRDIHAFDMNSAVIISAGSPAKVYRTEDGGSTWTESYSNDSPDIFFNSLDFWDEQNGIAVGDPIDGVFQIIKTTDGGNTWEHIPAENIPAAVTGEAEFAASGTCIVVHGQGNAWFATGGATARVFRSNDWGQTWTAANTPMISGESTQGIFSLAFYDDMTGIAVGGDYREFENNTNNAIITSDGGATWILVEGGKQPGGFRSCVAYVPGSNGKTLVAVGTTGSDMSFDSGLSWASADTLNFHAVSFSDIDMGGWVSGGNGKIGKFIK